MDSAAIRTTPWVAFPAQATNTAELPTTGSCETRTFIKEFGVHFRNLSGLSPRTIIEHPRKMSNYKPKPIDTSSIRLSDDLLELTERLAENAHDHWAVLRIAEGWTWGPQRDEGKKEHPDLVPYAELPESEKQYDRNAALETLKAIVALGHKIQREQ
jgi:hypothetical protein